MRHRAKQMSCVDSNLVIDAQSKQMFNPKLGKITKIFPCYCHFDEIIVPFAYFSAALIWQTPCVIVPIGQNAHHVRGLYNTITISPISVDVNIIL